jgi:hypothetical protein
MPFVAAPTTAREAPKLSSLACAIEITLIAVARRRSRWPRRRPLRWTGPQPTLEGDVPLDHRQGALADRAEADHHDRANVQWQLSVVVVVVVVVVVAVAGLHLALSEVHYWCALGATAALLTKRGGISRRAKRPLSRSRRAVGRAKGGKSPLGELHRSGAMDRRVVDEEQRDQPPGKTPAFSIQKSGGPGKTPAFSIQNRADSTIG